MRFRLSKVRVLTTPLVATRCRVIICVCKGALSAYRRTPGVSPPVPYAGLLPSR
jgi:hypothetical protein